jgi:hypothetical protein
VLLRGERRRSSPSPKSFSSSALHPLFTAFLVRIAGAGKGTGKELGSVGSGSEGLGSECLGTGGLDSEGSGRRDGDFARGGGGLLGAVEEGANFATTLASLVMS